MAQQVRFFVCKAKVKNVLETLNGYNPPVWSSLKFSMLAYWGQVDTAHFTLPDLEALTQSWTAKEGVSSFVDYQDFRRVWEPIQSYLLRKAHIDSVEEVRTFYYRSLSTGVQECVHNHLIKAKTMITMLDNRFKLPSFKISKEAVANVMEGQTALTFEDPRMLSPVPVGAFQQGNKIMQQMEKDRCPAAPKEPSKPSATVNEISQMFQSFEPWLEKKFTAQPPQLLGRPICHFVASFQPAPVDLARKKHKMPKPYKAPPVSPLLAKRPGKKPAASHIDSDVKGSDMEAELFERISGPPVTDPISLEQDLPSKPTSSSPKVRFERGIAKDHPNAFKGVLNKISGLKVPEFWFWSS
ncbi:hypothetical protein PTTG_05475 [Puccinia triticina 1-1 BBBD Race 1]|uniref:Uncharacterized protein n=1 Tax=Puccinia triticina (isolate 1-1 / race 1 (BBBD)) TaxID=630390 RepID=A0A180GFG4_PUCT1|nr:hypothetical protein PTTG_05475 [Puccinia triticina 1-1 BBBD Race 1]